MPSPKRTFGDRAETFAAEYFRERGFRVLARNFLTRYGELDLVLEKERCLHVIEVKARASSFQSPFEAITQKKRQHLARAIELWLRQHPVYESYNYQIDAFCLWREGCLWKTEWLEGI